MGDNQKMANEKSPSALPQAIQDLLDLRDQHVRFISNIDTTLETVAAALNGTAVSSAAPTKMTSAPVPKPPVAKKRRGRGSFAVSATELVLKYLGTNKNPTTKEITQHLVSAGRSLGAVSNALSVLTKAKKLKRTPLGKGQMGSTYSLA
jgi:hypothetical protein